VILLRKIFFYAFLLIYLIFCPTLIFYALGYLYHPGQEHGIVKTGLIRLSTVPPKATIFVGDRRYSNKTPVVLRDLVPGEYSVSVHRRGHKPWVYEVQVEAEKATVFERILLLPKTFKQDVLISAPLDEMIPMPGNDFFLVTKGPKLGDVQVYDWKEKKSRTLIAQEDVLAASKVMSFHVVPESPYLLVQFLSQERERIFWMKVGDKETEFEDLSGYPLAAPFKVMWDSRDEESLFLLQDRNVHRLRVKTRSFQKSILKGVRGLGLFKKMIYVLDEDFVFFIV